MITMILLLILTLILHAAVFTWAMCAAAKAGDAAMAAALKAARTEDSQC